MVQPKFTVDPDQALWEQYKSTGKSIHLATLYKRYAPKVLGLCMYYLKNEQDSMDAVMDIFEQILNRGDTYDIKLFDSWLYRVTKNHCLKVLQRKLRHMATDLSEIDEDIFVEKEGLQALLEREAKLNALAEAVEELNTHQRTCICLHYFSGLSYREIAEQTEYNPNEVKSHIQNGKRNLRLAFENFSPPF